MNLAHHLLPHVAYIHTYIHILHTFLKKVQETAPPTIAEVGTTLDPFARKGRQTSIPQSMCSCNDYITMIFCALTDVRASRPNPVIL